MAFKFNKEMILKNKFWLLLSLSGILAFAGMMVLWAEEPSADHIKSLEGAHNKSKNVKGVASDITIQGQAKRATEAGGLKLDVWTAAYNAQESLFYWAKKVEDDFAFQKGKFIVEIKIEKDAPADKKSWPDDTPTLMHGLLIDYQRDYLKISDRAGKEVRFYPMTTMTLPNRENGQKMVWDNRISEYRGKLFAISFQNGKYFGDGLMNREASAFSDSYTAQIHDILRLVDPMNIKGDGVVLLKDWLYDPDKLPHEDGKNKDPKFIRYVADPWKINKDISKEAWIAQENIWVQAEIYRIIRSVNDSICKFKGKGSDKRAFPHKFSNDTFDLDLTLQADSSLTFKIKNRLKKRQKLDLSFRVALNKSGPPEILKVSGLPLMPVGDGEGKDFLMHTFLPSKDQPARQGVFAVEQLLTMDSAAVKRIDHVSIGSNGPDDISHSNRTYPDNLRPFDLRDLQAPPVPGGDKPPPMFPPPGGGGGGANAPLLEHGLWANRYKEVTDQSRRIPIALVLIVDQDHVDRVMSAFNNSKMRFLETQVLLNHYTEQIQPPALPIEVKADAGVGVVPKFGFGREQPGGPGMGIGVGVSSSEESNMELVIYGIMTLYQRYHPRPAMAERK